MRNSGLNYSIHVEHKKNIFNEFCTKQLKINYLHKSSTGTRVPLLNAWPPTAPLLRVIFFLYALTCEKTVGPQLRSYHPNAPSLSKSWSTH